MKVRQRVITEFPDIKQPVQRPIDNALRQSFARGRRAGGGGKFAPGTLELGPGAVEGIADRARLLGAENACTCSPRKDGHLGEPEISRRISRIG